MQLQIAPLKNRHLAWVKAINEGDIESWQAIVTEDIIWIPPGETIIKGRVALGDWLRPFIESYNYKYAIVEQTVRMVGEHALEQSYYISQQTSKDNDVEAKHNGKYIALWRQEKDEWYIERYVDVSELGVDN